MDYVKEAENYLRSYNDLTSSVDNLKREISEINAELACIKNTDYSGMPHGSGSRLPDDILVNKLYRKQKAIEELKKTSRAINRIDYVLKKLSEGEGNEKHEKVLRLFYIEGARGQALEEALECSERHCYRLKGIAIRRLAVQLFGIKGLGE
ncbi:DUF1492 domain-containing protein [Clostridium sp. JN-9]|uniref:DUF1492 domain-containing protein n=1 Tax=Clostridium sp. JN-9 TaxID=2507159 RepID=UPI000FFE2AC0|nr:DUF1492 domain-containing protein [Clostridium sp. JN-9]QAT40853.1 DUF1492 domain-containing protein [Clostridium sp. JN-9]